MKKHEAGALPKSCYADDGHIYMNELLRNGNPNNAMHRSKDKDDKLEEKKLATIRKMKEERDYLLKHPELKQHYNFEE